MASWLKMGAFRVKASILCAHFRSLALWIVTFRPYYHCTVLPVKPLFSIFYIDLCKPYRHQKSKNKSFTRKETPKWYRNRLKSIPEQKMTPTFIWKWIYVSTWWDIGLTYTAERYRWVGKKYRLRTLENGFVTQNGSFSGKNVHFMCTF